MLLLLLFLLLLLLLAVGYVEHIKALRGGEGGETRNGAASGQRSREAEAGGRLGGGKRVYRADAWPCSEGERRGMVD